MSFLTWDEKYSVNIEEIDEQHKSLFKMISDFNTTINSNNETKIETMLDSLIDYASYHFTTEEELFEKYNFPDKNEHKQIHNTFNKKVNNIYSEFQNGSLTISSEISTFLKDWIQTHILKIDKQYSNFLTEKGVS